jgi:hypothetical protein
LTGAAKLEGMMIGAVPPPETVHVARRYTGVMDQQIGFHGKVVTGYRVLPGHCPFRRPRAARSPTDKSDDALFSPRSEPRRSRVADKRRADVKWTDVEGHARHRVAGEPRQVAKVDRKQGRREIARQARLQRERAARRPPNVDLDTRIIERPEEAQPLNVIHVQMGQQDVDPRDG